MTIAVGPLVQSNAEGTGSAGQKQDAFQANVQQGGPAANGALQKSESVVT